ncbi:MAG: hypothetical protein HFF18_07590 [Oscillospiraceae bacterium]|nr:hypothetical protein [Oscillospiraceae bacterium]
MKYRLWIAGTAAVLALCSVTAAVAAARMPAPAPAPAVSAAHTAQPPEETAAPEEETYLVRDYSGELCVFQGGELIERTGIPVATLPQSDRTMAEVGITVTGKAALAELLADLGS